MVTETDLRIDKNNLDFEIERHPSMMYEVGVWCVNAQSVADGLKLELERLAGALAERMKNELETSGKRVTEAGVSREIVVQPEYIAAQDKYHAARLEAARWTALRDAFTQRGYMLRDLVQLAVAQYFVRESVSVGQPIRRPYLGAAQQPVAPIERRRM